MIKGIKGVKDLLPDQIDRWLLIENSARRYARLYGFREIRLPIFEVTELFARSIGATTDIVEKEMYTFTDRDGSSLTLRPEGTAGAVRSYIEHNLGASPLPQKLFYLGPMFRHERPQAGRLRQFHQFGVELLGLAEPEADVEVLSLLWRYFNALRLPGLTLELNTLGETEDRPRYRKVLQKFLEPRQAALCANCQRRLDTNPLRVLDCKVPGCREATAGAPSIVDHISSRARDHFEAVRAGLAAIAVPVTLNSRLVRGLDYYTLTTFEVTCTHLGAQNAVGAGGRYDGLVEVLGGAPTPAIGFAVGLERIALLLQDDLVPEPSPFLYVAGFGQDGTATAHPLLDSIRQAGIEAICDYRSTTLKAHLRQSDRLHCSHTLIIGDDEVAKGVAILRNMVSKAQEEVPLASLVHDLSTRLLNG